MKKLLLILLCLPMIGFGQFRIHKDSLSNFNGSKYWKPDAEKKYNGILFTGIAFDIDANGTIIYECSYENGKKNGLERKWWRGNIEVKSYINGKKTGISRTYDRSEGWSDYFYINDSLVVAHTYDKNGELYIKVEYCTNEGHYPEAMSTVHPLDKLGYYGICVNGNCVNGLGRKVYDNGMIYNGNFINHSRSGLGVLYSNTDTLYGEWINDYRVKVCDFEYPIKNQLNETKNFQKDISKSKVDALQSSFVRYVDKQINIDEGRKILCFFEPGCSKCEGSCVSLKKLSETIDEFQKYI